MNRPPPKSTLTHTLYPDPTLFRSHRGGVQSHGASGAGAERRGHLVRSPAPRRSVAVRRPARGGDAVPRPERARRPIQPQQLAGGARAVSSEEHTSEIQSHMRISYAVYCVQKKTDTKI